jgi:uncharacterized protein YuzE
MRGAPMDLTYNSEFNIAYIRLRRKTAKVTTIAVSPELNVDLGPDGRIYGIELLNANEQLGSQRVKTLNVLNRRSGKKGQLALAG